MYNADSNHYKFTGKERDSESGLDYFGARYYSNGLGRFITPDWAGNPVPVPFAVLADPQTLNLYSYVRNIPTVRVDLDGHRALTDDDRQRIKHLRAEAKKEGISQKNINRAVKDIKAAIKAVPKGQADPANLKASFWAIDHIGDKNYGYQRSITFAGTNVGPNTWKCNLFVGNAYVQGAGVGTKNMGTSLLPDSPGEFPTNTSYLGLGHTYPPVAGQLGNPEVNLPNLPVASSVGVGDVVSFPQLGDAHTSISLGGNLLGYTSQNAGRVQTTEFVQEHKGNAATQEGNITITHPDEPGVNLNLRTETHPLEPGGQPVRHVNVEKVTPRTATQPKTVKNTHITD